jgi:hypothetical protein
MATAFRVWVGVLVHNGNDISVPATLQRYDDTDPPPPDQQGGPPQVQQQWDVSTALGPGDVGGLTNPQIKQLLAERIVLVAQPIADLWYVWEGIEDAGNRVLPGWP